jgi:hypothetical protein
MDFVFKTEWMNAISKLKPEQQAEAYSAIRTIVEEQSMPEGLSFEVDFLLTAIYSQIVDGMDIPSKRGAPKGNRNAAKKQIENNSETIEKQKKQIKTNKTIDLNCFSEKEETPSPPTPPTTPEEKNNSETIEKQKKQIKTNKTIEKQKKQIKTNKTIDLNCFSEKEETPSPPTPPTTPEEKALEEKENYDYVVAKEREKPTSPTATEIIPVSEIEDVLMGEDMWVEAMCYKYNLPRDRLAVQIHTIKRGWIERGQDYKTIQDAKKHADSLLNIRRANGELAQPPAWNEFLYDLMAPHIDDLGYDDEIFTAFGRHYMQDVGNGKPFFIGIPRFEEEIYERMKNFKESYKPPEYEQPVQSGSGSQSA